MNRDRLNLSFTVAFELAPSALLGASFAFAVTLLAPFGLAGGLLASASVSSGTAAALVTWAILRRIGSNAAALPMPGFQAAPVEPCLPVAYTAGELLLTEKFSAPAAVGSVRAEELVLDDIIESLGPDSRVVRLLQPCTFPTAGELQARIDRHLSSGPPHSEPPDASKALHEALNALRQSLR